MRDPKEVLQELLYALEDNGESFKVDGHELEHALRYGITAIHIVEEIGKIIDMMENKEKDEE